MQSQEVLLAQNLINQMAIGEKKCLKEIYEDYWKNILNPTEFGKKFKRTVSNKILVNIRHNGIRSTGRCDEYERI